MKQGKKYKFSHEHGFNAKAIDANEVARSFEELRKGPGLTPPNLVEAAKPDDHPAHDGFEWDDLTAAHEFRLTQARHMIRSIVVFQDEKPERVYYNVTAGKDRTYEHKDVVVKNPDYLSSAMNLLISELESAKRALMELEAAANMKSDVKAMARATMVRKPLEQAIAAARA